MLTQLLHTMSAKKAWVPGIVVVCIYVILFCAISIYQPVIPISYDEAWNYSHISSKGAWYSMTNYPFANNHVFFTLLQSITVPKQLLWHFPEATRMLNVIVGAALVLFLFQYFKQWSRNTLSFWSILAVIACLFFSPVVAPFFIVARGYFLGMALLLFGLYAVVQRRMMAATLLFILSGWTVITYVYCLPGIYILLFYLYRKGNWKKIAVSALLTGIGLYTLYKPILLLILSQGTLWTAISFQDFLYQIWRNLSYMSYFSWAWIGSGIIGVVYAGSIVRCIYGHTSKNNRYFFMLLLGAMVSYVSVVGVASHFHIANPPYDRAGIFIPFFIALTIAGCAQQEKTSWMRILLWTVLSVNSIAGIYWFASSLPFSSPNHYPYNISYLAPSSYPITDWERKGLRERNISFLKVPESGDDTFALYFSKIYSVGLLYPKKPDSLEDEGNSSVRLASVSAVFPQKKEPAPIVLPGNPLYMAKKAVQRVVLEALTFFPISRKPRMLYLLFLSDLTYTEAEMLWNNGRYALSMQTLGRAEHYMTILAGELGDFIGLEHPDGVIIWDIGSSMAYHRLIMGRLVMRATDNQKKDLTVIELFSEKNRDAIMAISGQQL